MINCMLLVTHMVFVRVVPAGRSLVVIVVGLSNPIWFIWGTEKHLRRVVHGGGGSAQHNRRAPAKLKEWNGLVLWCYTLCHACA
jgi:hypothetical protein